MVSFIGQQLAVDDYNKISSKQLNNLHQVFTRNISVINRGNPNYKTVTLYDRDNNCAFRANYKAEIFSTCFEDHIN